MIYALMIFVGAFAIAPGLVSKTKDKGPAVIKTIIAIGAVGWVAGILIQVVTYGLVTAPCCQ